MPNQDESRVSKMSWSMVSKAAERSSRQLLPSEFELEGYKVFCLGLDNRKSRGILFYVAINLEVSVVDIPFAFEECLFLTAKSSSGQKILIGNIYRSRNSLQENDNELYELFEYCERYFKMPNIFVGDFNFRNIDWYPTRQIPEFF